MEQEKSWLTELVNNPDKLSGFKDTANTDPKKRWIKDVIKANENMLQYDKLFSEPIVRTGETGIGESIYDKNAPFEALAHVNETRAQKEPWIAKFSAGIGRVGSKTLTEIAKMPGVVIGGVVGAAGQIVDAATGKDNTDFMKVAFDNPWVRTLNEINETVNTEVLPVYVSKAVSEGSLWDNITSIDFWATEGADGLGYIVSMLVPGALINKFGLGSKLFGINKLAKMVDKTDDAVKAMGGLNITPKSIDLLTGTIANTIFEAGAEAQGAMKGYEDSLKQQLQMGDITQAEFDQKIGKASEIGRNVFFANAIILVGPNAVMSKMLWGKPRNKSIGNLFNKAKKFAQEDAPTKLRTVKLWGDDFAKAAGREAFWEEGLQSTTEQYFTKNEDSGLGDFIGDLPNAYADMISETDGQKAILLGAAFGGGMQMYSGNKERKYERESRNKLINAANTVLDDMFNVFSTDTYVTDEEGNTVYNEDGSPKKDYKKASEKLKSLNSFEQLSVMYDVALENNDKETLDQIKGLVTTHIVKPFIINNQLGLDALEEYLNKSQELIPVAEREKTTPENFIAEIMSKAKVLKDAHKVFSDFSPGLINLENETATEENKKDYFNKLSNIYLNNKGREHDLKKELEKLKEVRSIALKEAGLAPELVTEDETLVKAEKDNRLLNTINDKVRQIESSLKTANEVNNAFWDNKTVNEAFDAEIAKEQTIIKNATKENIEKLDIKLQQVKDAKTDEDLDKIESGDVAVVNAIANKRKELKLKKLKEDNEKRKSNKEFAAKNPLVSNKEYTEFIQNNYNNGEVINLPDGREGTISNISGTNVTVDVFDGETKVETITFTSKEIYETNSGSTTNTEGGTEAKYQEPTSQEEVKKEIDKQEEKKDTPVRTTNYKTGLRQPWVSQSAIDFERSPVDKRGQQKGFIINTDTDNNAFTPNQRNAIAAYLAGDFSDMDLLIDHLPINVILSEEVYAPIETKSEVSEKFNDTFNEKGRVLRATIINELASGTPLEAITTEIAGQYSGEIQLDESLIAGEVVENNLVDLYEIGGDIKNIKIDNIYVVDDFGTLRNHKGDIHVTERGLAPGEIYLMIHRANGVPFPLKLNNKPISEQQAELLYEIYSYRFQNIKEGKGVKLVDTSEQLQEKVKQLFAKELELFAKNKKPFKDLTIKDVVDFLVWDGTNSPKTRIKFINGSLYVMDKVFTIDYFSNSKESFINSLTGAFDIGKAKRHNVRYKKDKTEGVNAMTLENRSYLEYIIENGILNTNAVVGKTKPTFAGRTDIFLNTDAVKVNGKLSKHNPEVLKSKPKPVRKSKDTKSKDNKPDAKNKNNTGDEMIVLKDEGEITSDMITPEGAIDLSAYGIEAVNTIPTVPKAPKAPLSKEEVALMMKNVGEGLVVEREGIQFEGLTYNITKGTYFVMLMDTENKKIIPLDDIGLISRIIDSYNKTQVLPGYKIDKDEVIKRYTARLSKPVVTKPTSTSTKAPAKKITQIKATTKVLTFENMSKEKAMVGLKTILVSYPHLTLPMTRILDKNKNVSEQKKLEILFNFLQEKNISKSELETKCGLK